MSYIDNFRDRLDARRVAHMWGHDKCICFLRAAEVRRNWIVIYQTPTHLVFDVTKMQAMKHTFARIYLTLAISKRPAGHSFWMMLSPFPILMLGFTQLQAKFISSRYMNLEMRKFISGSFHFLSCHNGEALASPRQQSNALYVRGPV